jgi:hypothetical protein
MESIFYASFDSVLVRQSAIEYGISEADIDRLDETRTATFEVMSQFVDIHNKDFIHNCGIFYRGMDKGYLYPFEKWLISYLTYQGKQITKLECWIYFIIRPTSIEVKTLVTSSLQFGWDTIHQRAIISKNWTPIEKFNNVFDPDTIQSLFVKPSKTNLETYSTYLDTMNRMRNIDGFVRMVLN